MGKEKNPRRVADNEAMSKLRMLKTSPQKLNLLAGLIRGKKVDRALNDLTFSKKRIVRCCTCRKKRINRYFRGCRVATQVKFDR